MLTPFMLTRLTKSTVAAFAIITLFSCAQESDAPQPSKATAEAEPVAYTFFRNATAKLRYAGKTYLLDPMLSEKGALPSFAGIAPNPTIDLPVPIDAVTDGVDAVIVGHMHADHFDTAAAEILDKATPIITPHNKAPVDPADPENTTMGFADQLAGYGFTNVTTIGAEERKSTTIDGVTFTQEFGRHGRGVLTPLLGGVNGIVLEAEGAPTLYWTGDTILDEEGNVAAILATYTPDIIIAHTGGAVIEALSPDPLMMDEPQMTAFVSAAKTANPHVQIIAVHMDALDHCFTTKATLRTALNAAGLSENVFIPHEGETVRFDTNASMAFQR